MESSSILNQKEEDLNGIPSYMKHPPMNTSTLISHANGKNELIQTTQDTLISLEFIPISNTSQINHTPLRSFKNTITKTEFQLSPNKVKLPVLIPQWTLRQNELYNNLLFDLIGPVTSQSLVEQIRDAPSLAEAIEISGVEIKSVSDLVLIRNDVERPGPYEHSYPNARWLLHKQFEKVLFIHGPTGTGKTQWALHQFKNPLLVSHLDTLRKLTGEHDGIVFDDMSFAHMPRESVIHLLDWDERREIHCRYSCAIIPAHTRKIFTSNKDFAEVFPYDESGAIRRRITDFCRVSGPTFIDQDPTEEAKEAEGETDPLLFGGEDVFDRRINDSEHDEIMGVPRSELDLDSALLDSMVLDLNGGENNNTHQWVTMSQESDDSW